MSKISQELKVLLYLNQRYTRTKWITIKEIADYLEVSDRQARRYLEDLNMISDIDIETKLGRDGGYRLRTPLDKGFAMPENIVLAMSIAMKRNEKIESVLSELPNYVITDSIVGDNKIGNDVLDNLEVILYQHFNNFVLVLNNRFERPEDYIHNYIIEEIQPSQDWFIYSRKIYTYTDIKKVITHSSKYVPERTDEENFKNCKVNHIKDLGQTLIKIISPETQTPATPR